MQPKLEPTPAQEATSPGPVLELIDRAAPGDLFAQACAVCQGKGWYFGNASNQRDGSQFWKMDLDGNAVFDAIWEHVRPQCEALAGAPLRVLRQYANGHTYGLGGRPHADDHRPGTFTFLYYPMPEWKDSWDGETVFYEASGEIMFAVKPRPNRGVFFDSRIAHNGRAPSRSCAALRVTVAYKLEVVREDQGGPVPAAAASQEEEVRQDGAARVFRIRIPSAKIDAAVSERLAGLAKSLRLPGFGAGHIPAEVLEQRYGAQARRECLRRFSDEAIKRAVPSGTLLSAVELKSGEDSGDAVVEATGTFLPDLPTPEFSQVPLLRLIVTEGAAQAAGVSPPEAEHLVREHLKRQALDALEAACRIPVMPALVGQEMAAIWKALEDSGAAPANEQERAQRSEELRPVAERRVRLGYLVAELARRAGVSAKDGAELENKVIDQIVSAALLTERDATAEELRDLAAE